MQSLDYFMQAGKEILDELDIKYAPKITYEMKNFSVWGRCRKLSNTEYHIQINTKLLKDDVTEQAILNTVVHELLHTCKDCMRHTGEWKRLANIVNKECTDLNIKRCTSSDEKGVVLEHNRLSYKYAFICPDCGQTFKRKRKPKYSASCYKCPCGSKNLKLITL